MRYITIEREYGSGATKIAQKLAKECNVPCYGAEILEAAAAKMNMTSAAITEYEEKATNSLFYSLYLLGHIGSGSEGKLSREGKVYLEEQNAIREFADKSDAIFIGHCASEALRDYKNVINVFIHADEDTKRARIREDYGIEDSQIDATERKINRRRANYYEINVQKKWANLGNYDIVLDSSKLGIDGCVEILKVLFRR